MRSVWKDAEAIRTRPNPMRSTPEGWSTLQPSGVLLIIIGTFNEKKKNEAKFVNHENLKMY